MQQNVSSSKIAIYSRKSKFTEKGDSVDVQIELCKSIMRTKNMDLKDDDFLIFVDEGYSGKNTDRPRFQEMMKWSKKRAFQTVVCYRIDRISRNIVDFHEFTEELQKNDISFVSVTESCDTSTPMGRAMLSICSVFAQLERETIAERIRDNMLELAKSGRWLGGTAPTGYQSVQLVDQITEEGKARKAFKLDVIPEEAQLVKMIFDKFVEANSLTKVETYFIQNHIKTKNGKEFTRFSIKNILQNPVYAANDEAMLNYFEGLGTEIHAEKGQFNGRHGMMVYNKTEQNTAKTHVTRNSEEWVVSIGRHEPLVSGETWLAAQALLGQNKDKGYHKPKSTVSLLSGLLYCGDCGRYMRPKLSKRVNAQGEYIYSYLCETKEKSRMANCKMKNPLGNELDDLVCRKVKMLAMDQSDFRKQLKQAQTAIHSESKVYDETLKSLKVKARDTEDAIKQLIESLVSAIGTPAHQYITDEINHRHEELEGLKQSVEEFEKLSQQQKLDSTQFDLMDRQLTFIAHSFDEMTIEQKRMALKTVIRKIVWDGTNAHIYFFGDNEENAAPVDFTGVSSLSPGGATMLQLQTKC